MRKIYNKFKWNRIIKKMKQKNKLTTTSLIKDSRSAKNPYSNIRFQCKLCRQESQENEFQDVLANLFINETKKIGDLTFKQGFCASCKFFFNNSLNEIDQHVLLSMINKDKFTSKKLNNVRRSIAKWKIKNKEEYDKILITTTLEAL